MLRATNRKEFGSVAAWPARLMVPALGLFALIWAVIRAYTQSITIDEAETYEIFVGRDSPSWWEAASNNHVLNSLAMRLFTSVLGLSHLSVRAPALIGAAIYIVAALALCGMIARGRVLRVVLFATLVYNPLVFDFFVAARGYSLAVAFLLATIACAAWARKGHGDGPELGRFLAWYALSSLCAGLSFCANFSFGLVLAALMLTVLAWGWTRPLPPGPRARVLLVAAGTLPAVTVTVLIAGRTLLQWPSGQLWFGATSLCETFRTVIRASLFEPSTQLFPPRWIPVITQLGWFLVVATVCAVAGHSVLLWVNRKHLARSDNIWLLQLGIVLAATLTLTLAAHEVAFRLFHLLLPMHRTAMYLVPLCTLLAGIVAAVEWRDAPHLLSIGRGVIVSLLTAIGLYYASCIRLTYFEEWQYDADVKTVYDRLATLNHALRIDDIPSSWRYSGSLNFYRRLSGKETFREFVGSDTGAYPHGKRAYVLCFPFDLPFVRSERLKVAYRGENTGIVIALRPQFSTVRGHAHDDIDPQIAFAGEWIHDAQFSQPAYGTLTYSSHVGDCVRFRFTGTGLIWVYTKTLNRGMAQVTIDGVSAGIVDQYSPVTVWRSRSRFSGLSAGPHEVEIRVLGQKNARATNTFIDLDLLIVE